MSPKGRNNGREYVVKSKSKPQPVATFTVEAAAWAYVQAMAQEGIMVSLTWEHDRIDAYSA